MEQGQIILVQAPRGHGQDAWVRDWREARSREGRTLVEIDLARLDRASTEAMLGELVEPAACILLDWDKADPLLAKALLAAIARAPSVAWLIVSRVRIDLDLVDARLAGRVRTVEVAELLDAAGGGEGDWPLLDALAAASSSGEALPPEVRDYIEAQVIDVLAPEEIETLVAASFLDPVDPVIAASVIGREGLARHFENIADRTSLLQRVPGASGASPRYRMARLLRLYFQRELALGDEERSSRIKAQAAVELGRTGDIDLAAKFLLDDRRWEEAADLMEAQGVAAILLKGLPRYRELFARLPADYRLARPRLQLMWIYVLLRSGRVKEASRAFETLRRETLNFWRDRPDGSVFELQVNYRLVEMVLFARSGNVPPQKKVMSYELFFDENPMIGAVELGNAYQFMALSSLMSGDLVRAEEFSLSATQVTDPQTLPTRLFWRQVMTGLAALERCEIDSAMSWLDAARNEAERLGSWLGPDHAVWLELLDAGIRYELNMITGLADDLRATLRRAGENEAFFTITAEGSLGLAAACFGEQGLNAALEAIEQAEQAAHRSGRPGFAGLYTASRVRLLLRGARAAKANEVMEAAGLAYRLRGMILDQDRPWRELVETALAVGGCEIVSGQADRALPMLGQCVALAREKACGRSEAKLSLLIAAAHFHIGNSGEAGRGLSDALSRLVPRRIFRPLIDEAYLIEPLLQAVIDTPARFAVMPDTPDMAALTLRVINGAQGSLWFGEKELLVLRLLGQGLSNKRIAREVHVTESTVKYHLKRIFAKLGVSGREEAVLNAKARGVI